MLIIISNSDARPQNLWIKIRFYRTLRLYYFIFVLVFGNWSVINVQLQRTRNFLSIQFLSWYLGLETLFEFSNLEPVLRNLYSIMINHLGCWLMSAVSYIRNWQKNANINVSRPINKLIGLMKYGTIFSSHVVGL